MRTRLDLTALEDRTVPVASVSITALDSAASEWDADPGTFRFSRTGSTAAALTINVQKLTGGGPSGEAATEGTDFSYSPSVGTTVVIPVGASYKDVTLTPVDDTVPEVAESAGVQILSGSGYTISGSSSAWVTIGDNDAQLTFSSLGGYKGAIGYTVPWDSVDASQSSQSIALTDFKLNVAGKVLPGSGETVTTSPTIQFAYGVFTGVTFGYNTSAVASFPFNSVSMSGLTVSAVMRVGGQNVTATATVTQPMALFDFSSFTTGVGYRLEVRVKDAGGNVIDEATVTIAAGATKQDVVTTIAAALDGDQVEVVAMANARLLIRSKKTPIDLIAIRALNLGDDSVNQNIKNLYYVGKHGMRSILYNGEDVPPKPAD
ncbi:MAG: hypothetical protein K2X87_29810 [Gemmataceae bacterium]|nr:hypothetical protein [Gemmataceae bacterium]